jgi:hypothetical protein
MAFRSLRHAAVITAAGAAMLGGSTAHAQSSSSPATVRNVVLVSIPGHPSHMAPYYAVFSATARLTRERDSEDTLRYPGGVGIDGPAAMRIYDVAAPHRHHGSRWCYAAEASGTVWHTLHAGRSYPVHIALSDNTSVPRTNVIRRIRTRTIQDAAAALGC